MINGNARRALSRSLGAKTWGLRCMTTAVHFAAPSLGPASSFAHVRFFGRVADACGRSVMVAIPSHGCSLAELRVRIARQLEGGEAAMAEPCVRVAIDQVMAADDPWVTPGQEVAFLSAFSGG